MGQNNRETRPKRRSVRPAHGGEQRPVQERQEAEQAGRTPGETKYLGAQVSLATHHAWRTCLLRAQKDQPNLTSKDALPVLIRLLEEESVWKRFREELAKL